ncbi:MAG: 4-hydroxy-tetrahydrodipicolinate reductase [Gammaproteobacteria bacterium]|nr:4-hydroxy-tetrahydrodipicolinate reductase [Gammaproteobacteria bacterium]
MGQAVAEIVARQSDLALAGIWTRGESVDDVVAVADVVVDFSLPQGTEQVVAAVLRHGKPLVCGVSGLDERQMQLIDAAAGEVAVVYDRNMSLGIAVLTHSVREAAASLGSEFEIEISETHHVHKRDAPSGTALKLGEAIAASRGEAGTGSVRFHSERRGEVPGDHEVRMTSPSEQLTFAHSVTSRQVFADGAVRAARWCIGKAPGRYQMRDVLFDTRPIAGK